MMLSKIVIVINKKIRILNKKKAIKKKSQAPIVQILFLQAWKQTLKLEELPTS